MRHPFLLCLTLLVLSRAAFPAAAAGRVTFAGRVVDAAGKPAGGATVYVRYYDAPLTQRELDVEASVRRTTAAADGTFRLVVPMSHAEWWVVLSAGKEGHGPGGQTLASPSLTTGLVLALTRPSSIAGDVVDRAGRPVAGATVKVRHAQWPSYELAPLLPEEVRSPATTDGGGRFRLSALPAGCRFTLAAEHPAYARWDSTGERITAGMQDVKIAMAPAGAIVARVVTEDGRPAANAVVRCGGTWAPLPAATTDAAGRVRFNNLGAGTYILTAALAGEFPALAADAVGLEVREGTEAKCPDLRLVRGGVVTGTVRNEQGRPVVDVDLISVRELHLPHFHTVAFGPGTRTGTDGSYRLRLPPGTWRVCLASSPAGYFHDPQWQNYSACSVGTGKTTRADFTLRRAVVTRLRVLDATGRPAAGATVRRGFGLKQSADAAGRCTVGRLPPGESISLTVLSRDGSQGALVQVGSARRAERPEGRGESIARLQPLPVVSGAVKDTSGRAIPEAWVNVDRLVPAGGGMSGQMPEPVTVRTADRQGRFSLPLFPGGQFRVTVEAPGYGAVDRFPVQVRRGKVPTPLRITLVRAEGEIAGAVVDPDGKPLAGARVSAGRGGATGVFVVNEETATDEQGRFRIHRLPPGVVNLAASQAGYYGDRREKVPVGAVNVRFVLAPIEEAASELSMARVGVTAPEIRVARWLNGDGVTSWTALRGKTVVLQFSSAYNRAARASNEALKALHARLREAGRNDVVILAVYDASAPADEVAAYARSEGLPFPIGLVEPSRNLGVDSAAFRAYGVRRLPALFVIDRDGILRAIDPDHEELARRLEMKAGQ